MILNSILLLFLALGAVRGKTLWSTEPVSNFSNIIQEAYPIGNGFVGALPFGVPGHEKLNLNEHTLWSGGPFENSSYDGGNPPQPVSSALVGIRSLIFSNGTGNGSLTPLMGDANDYGSYAVLGNLTISIEGVESQVPENYNRSLDLSTGIHTTSFSAEDVTYTSQVYCSYPDMVCVYDLSSTNDLPEVHIEFENVQSNASLVDSSCSAAARTANLDGITQADIGMIYRARAAIVGESHTASCSADGILSIKSTSSSLTIVVAAGTNYDASHGTASTGFSFKGTDPESRIDATISRAVLKSSKSLLSNHIADFASLTGSFSLDLPDTAGSAGLETSALYDRYTTNSSDPYLEALQFDYGRYLFISSSRTGSLPPNLQGMWVYSLTNAWSSDYHVDINLQMNHWGVDQVGLGALQGPLWDYLIQTWIPRGTQTASLVYGAPGFVAHGYVNTFGATGLMEGDEYWAALPMSAVWLAQQISDHYDYSGNTTWLADTAYPLLLKPIAQFWLSQLQQDLYFKDGTLVVNPCDSPEHGPTTFGCTHYQQLIHAHFVSIVRYAPLVNDTDASFLNALDTALTTLDKGLHIGSWGQVQEWKLDIDFRNDTHRHLSNLIGWYPGSSLSSYLSGYTNSTIQTAVATTLYSRGPGIADANAGWEKVWRSACWARLNNTDEAYYELRLTIQENFVANGLSMYSGHAEPFQIDANFGYVGAVTAMLVVDLPAPLGKADPRAVVLGPAIPPAWAGGRVQGLRIRGGGIVNFGWDNEGVVRKVDSIKDCGGVRLVNVLGDVLYEG